MEIRLARNAGGVLKQARLRAGLTQAGLAKTIGVSRKWVVDVESGANTAFHFDTYLRALQAVGLTMTIANERDTDDGEGEVRRSSRAPSSSREEERADTADSHTISAYFDALRCASHRFPVSIGGLI